MYIDKSLHAKRPRLDAQCVLRAKSIALLLESGAKFGASGDSKIHAFFF